jgi:hypothetical protein
VEFGLRERPVNVIFGEQQKKAGTPPSDLRAEPITGFPGLVEPPAAQLVVTVPPDKTEPPVEFTAPTAPVCPDTSPLDVPVEPTTTRVAGPPIATFYFFRRDGSVTQGGKPAQHVRDTVGRSVVNPASVTGLDGTTSFSYDVIEAAGDTTTTTSYRVDNDGAQPGLKIVKVVTKRPTGSLEFAPETPVVVMTLPAFAENEAQRSAGADVVHGHGRTMVLTHQTKDRVRVPACGHNVDAWEVALDGSISSPDNEQNVTFKATLWVATQFGALIVGDVLSMDGTEQGLPISVSTKTLINSVPKAAR